MINVCKYQKGAYICTEQLKQRTMKPYEQLRKAEEIIDKLKVDEMNKVKLRYYTFW